MRYKVGETKGEEAEGGGVGVIVESREVAGGHLGVDMGDINRERVLNTPVSGLARYLPPPRTTTICEAFTDWVNSPNLHIPLGHVPAATQARPELP